MYLLGGIPLVSNSDILDTILAFRQYGGENYLLTSSNTYYSMTSIHLLNSTKIEILKSATTNNISITAVNHYSEAQLDLIKSDWMLFLITMACVLALVILVLVVICLIIIKKLRKKNQSICLTVANV